MVNVVECNNCIHNKVCGKKETYAKFVHEALKMCISPKDKLIWYTKDCADVIVDVQCSYFEHWR